MHDEDLTQLYSWVVENGLESSAAQTIISFLGYTSSNYPVLALARKSLDAQSSEFISYCVYSGLVQMVAETSTRPQTEDYNLKQTKQSLASLLSHVPESLVISSPKSSLLYFKQLSFDEPATFNSEFEAHIQSGLIQA